MSENVYDTAIAPKLLEICALCQEHGIPFSATVEYEPGQWGETRFLPEGANLTMSMLALVNHHGANVDGFIINLLRHCRQHGIDWSNSMVLSKIGGTYSASGENHG